MKATELRIGNLVHQPNAYGEPDGITTEASHHHIRELGRSNALPVCEPIPLTEEWLLKFGFDKPMNANWCEFNGFEIDTISELVYWLGNKKIVLKSVNQLQNLYFALTNEELTIK